jgi:hypothetical protein
MDLIMPLAHRWVDSSVKLSKARAWLQARDEIYFDDILWAMTYTLPHRLELTQSVFAKYPNEAAWVSQRLRESVTLKESLWDEALKFLAPALNGDKAALAKLSEMGSKDLAVGGLFEWVEERLLERKEKEAKAR